MKMLLERRDFSQERTLGALFIDSVFFCYTLEDCDRNLESGGKKIDGETCIPRGEYEVIIDYSNRFKCEMPHVLDVPQFEGIRIHCGNTAEDTHGCVLVGTAMTHDRLLNSRAAYMLLMSKLETAYNKGEKITLEVR